MKQKLINSIKIISSILIIGALGLDIWYLASRFTERTIPELLEPVVWIASIALVIHVIAGLIAAIIANTFEKNFLIYGIYTFFVGFIGLWELHQIYSDIEQQI